MAKISIPFDDSNYLIDESSLNDAAAKLKAHLSTVMNGSGATIELGGVSYNIDSTKLANATSNFVSHLGTISGSGSKVVVNGVEYSIDSNKIADAIFDIHAVLGGLHSDDESGSGDEGEVQKFTYGQKVTEGVVTYMYLGTGTLEEYRNSIKPQIEAELGMSFEEAVNQFAGGDEELAWEMVGATAESFVYAEPQWTVFETISKNIAGSLSIKSEIGSIPVTTIKV